MEKQCAEKGCCGVFAGKETYSREFGKNLVVPAKAGIHSEVGRANSLWIPAYAGMTEGCASARRTRDKIR